MSRRVVVHNYLPRRARDVNAFEHAVSREQEEKNRDEAYRRSGITRVSDTQQKLSRADWDIQVERKLGRKPTREERIKLNDMYNGGLPPSTAVSALKQ